MTTDVASLRAWRPGDAYRRIHWPYTARMNTPMVKEFDAGLAAQFWLLLDLHRPSHHYPDVSRDESRVASPADNTEELAVTMAASLAQRLMELGLPVGLAVNGESGGLLRPDSGPDHLNRIMESLAGAKRPMPNRSRSFSMVMRPHLNHFHSVTIITPNSDPLWIPGPAGPQAAERHRCRRAGGPGILRQPPHGGASGGRSGSGTGPCLRRQPGQAFR